MTTPEQIAAEVMEANFGTGTRWAEPNQYGESGFTLAQVESEIDAGHVTDLIAEAVRMDRDQIRSAPPANNDTHFTLTVTKPQIDTVLDCLHQEATAVYRRIPPPGNSYTPGPLDECCDAHAALFRQRVAEYVSLLEHRRRIWALIDVFRGLSKRPVVDVHPQTGVVISTTAVTLIYTDESGRNHEQPLIDVTDSGTLIDPDTGDDLVPTAVRIAP